MVHVYKMSFIRRRKPLYWITVFTKALSDLVTPRLKHTSIRKVIYRYRKKNMEEMILNFCLKIQLNIKILALFQLVLLAITYIWPYISLLVRYLIHIFIFAIYIQITYIVDCQRFTTINSELFYILNLSYYFF